MGLKSPVAPRNTQTQEHTMPFVRTQQDLFGGTERIRRKNGPRDADDFGYGGKVKNKHKPRRDDGQRGTGSKRDRFSDY